MFWGSGCCLIRRGVLILTQHYIYIIYVYIYNIHNILWVASTWLFCMQLHRGCCYSRLIGSQKGSLATPATLRPFGQGASSAPGALLCCRCFLCCGNGKTSQGFSFTAPFEGFLVALEGQEPGLQSEKPRSREEMPWPHHEGHHPIRFHDWTNNRLYLYMIILWYDTTQNKSPNNG